MSLEEKRKLYKCGDDYQTLDNVLTWEDYMKEHRDNLLKKSKRFQLNSSPFINVVITDRIRRMGEGNVFTHVCPSIHSSVCPHLHPD